MAKTTSIMAPTPSARGYLGEDPFAGLPSQEDPAFWKRVLQSAPMRTAGGGLMYIGDILSRPGYAVGNIYRAITEGQVDELVDVLRQFIPFGEFLEDKLGVDLAPNRKEDVGQMLGAYLKSGGMNPYLAGAAGLAMSIATDPVTYVAGGGVMKSVGAYGARAMRGTARAVRGAAESLKMTPYIGRLAGGGLKYYDIVKGGVVSALKFNRTAADIETAVRHGVLSQTHSSEHFISALAGIVGDGSMGFVDDLVEMVPSRAITVKTTAGLAPKSVPIYAKAMTDAYAPTLLAAMVSPGKWRADAAQALANRVIDASGASGKIISIANRGVSRGDAFGLLDETLTLLGGQLDNSGRMVMRQVRGRPVLGGAITGAIKGEKVTALVSHVDGADDVAAIAEKLYGMGAREVNIVTALYHPTSQLNKALDVYARGTQAMRSAMKLGKDKKTVGILQSMSEADSALRKLSMRYLETGDKKLLDAAGAVGSARRETVKSLVNARKAFYRNIAKVEGAPLLRDPVLKGYELHSWTDDFRAFAARLTPQEYGKVIKHVIREHVRRPEKHLKAFAEMFPGGVKVSGIPQRLKHLMRAGASGGGFVDDATRWFADTFREVVADDDVVRILGGMGDEHGFRALEEMILATADGRTSSGFGRYLWNMGRPIDDLNTVWKDAIRKTLGAGRRPPKMKIWEDDPLRLMAMRLHKARASLVAGELFDKVRGRAGKTLGASKLEELYPALKGGITPREVLEQVGSSVEWRHGGRMGILRGGEYDGWKFFTDIDSYALRDIGRKGVPSGAEIQRHLFDPATGTMVEDLLKMHNIPNFAQEKAAGLRALMGKLMDWFTGEMRGAYLLGGPRWPVRNTIDDTLRASLEYGPRYITRSADCFVAGMKNPERIMLHGRMVPWDELRKIGDQWNVFMGFSSQVGARGGALPSMVKGAVSGKSVWDEMWRFVGGDKGKFNPLSRNWLARKIRAVNDLLEDKRRMTALILGAEDAMEKSGVARGAWTMDDLLRAMPESAERLDKSIFIYSNITPWEKQVASKVVMFYPFYRKNLPFWFNKMVEKPAHVNGILRFFQHMGVEETEFERSYKAPFLRNMLHFKTGTDDYGRPTYAYGFGLSIEDVNRFVALGQGFRGPVYKFLASMNPVFKLPAEYISGKNFYFNNNIEDWNRAYEVMSRVPLLRDFLRVREERLPDGSLRWSADGRRLWWLQQLKPVMDVMPILDSMYGEMGWAKGRGQKKLQSAITGWVTGMNAHRGDPKLWSNIIERGALQEALKEYKARGMLRGHESWYLPKGYQGNPDEEEFVRRMLQEYGALSRRGGIR